MLSWTKNQRKEQQWTMVCVYDYIYVYYTFISVFTMQTFVYFSQIWETWELIAIFGEWRKWGFGLGDWGFLNFETTLFLPSTTCESSAAKNVDLWPPKTIKRSMQCVHAVKDKQHWECQPVFKKTLDIDTKKGVTNSRIWEDNVLILGTFIKLVI